VVRLSGFSRLTGTGKIVVVALLSLVVIVPLGFTTDVIANPFIQTFNFNSVEEAFPMLRIGDDPRRGTGVVGTPPPSGQFITCDSQLDGQFCSDILQSVNLLCKFKQAVEYRFVTGDPRVISSSDFDTFSPLFPETLSLIDPLVSREIVQLNVQPRLACPVPLLNDGTRVEFAVTAESSAGLRDGKLKIKVSAYDENGNLQTIITERQIIVPFTVFEDAGKISPIDGTVEFIGTERMLGNVNVNAVEIENRLNPTREFNTRVIIELSGVLFIEIPDLDTVGSKFVVTHNIGGRAGIENPITLMLDLIVRPDIPAPEVPETGDLTTTVTSIQPDKLVVDGESTTIKKVNVFFKMNQYSDAEGLPDCEAREKKTGIFDFFAQPLLAKVKGVKQASTGFSTNFSCEIPVTGDTTTGTYEVKISTPAVTPAGNPTRASTTTTFIVTLKIIDSPLPETCPTVAELRQQIADLSQDALLRQKANLLDKQASATATPCDFIKLPLVIAEVDKRGLTETPTPTPNGVDNSCGQGKLLVKGEGGTFQCVTIGGGTIGGFGIPKFIACAQGVTGDASLGEICLPPELFALFTFLTTGLNGIFVVIGIIIFAIIIKIAMRAVSGGGGGVVLKQ